MDHLRIHHREQHDAVVVGSSKGLTLAAFNAQRNDILFRGTIENTFSILRSFTTVSCISQNKNLTRKTQMVLHTGPSFLGFRAEYSVNAQTETKTRILLRFAQTEASPY
jgi:hypothetical protein